MVCLLRYSDSESSHDHDDDDEGDDDDEDEEDNGLRRSRRATKGRRFAYWKGERPIYESGTMVGLQPVEPTPVKKKKRKRAPEKEQEEKRKRTHNTSKGRKTVVEVEKEKGNRSGVSMGEELQDNDEEEEDEDVEQGDDAVDDFVVVDVPSSNKYVDRSDHSKFIVWNEYDRSETLMQVVRTTEFSQPTMQLQKGVLRPPERDQVGFACHVFNVDEVPGTLSGWLSGE